MYLGLVDSLAAQGRTSFSYQEFLQLTGSSAFAVKSALHRLQKKAVIAMPFSGFYVILPPLFRAAGCLPPDLFIPDLMEHLGEVYYTGLLSAAEFYGATHHRPQVFQVVVAKVRRPLICGKIRVEFILRKNAADIPTQTRNTSSGVMKVASPEATALDVICYVNHCAGLTNVATVMSTLAERIDPNRLVEVTELSPVSCAQRLGYLLELLGENDKAAPLADFIRRIQPPPTALVPGTSIKGAKKDRRWQIYVNAAVNPDL